MLIAVIIATISILAFILCILFQVKIPRKGVISVKLYPIVPLLGGLLMLVFGVIRISDVKDAFLQNSSVNPIKILILFLSMTIFSLILDRTGFFGYISGVVLKKAGHNQTVVFLSLYAVISLLTIFTSNDIVILTFTPFICYFCKSAEIQPTPYLMMEFVAANTWSLLFLIGNPTNIYISGAFEIEFFEYMRIMALPTVAVGGASLLIMLLLFKKQLKSPIHCQVKTSKITNKPLMVISLTHLLLCVVLLAISQYLPMEMWLISLIVALSVILCSGVCLVIQGRNMKPLSLAIRSMPFEIIPFIIGMFLIVLGLDCSGITQAIASIIPQTDNPFTFGFLSLFASNVLNNIPMSVLFSRILSFASSPSAIYATIAGSNIGAFLTPFGALAGIMWSNLVKQNKVRFSVYQFIGYGFLIGIPSFAASLLVLHWIL